jgi:hypothetical protein
MTPNIDNALYLKEQRKLLWLLLCPELPETPNMKAAQQLITSYCKVDKDIRNQLKLLLAALEAGSTFLNEIDMGEDYYDAMMGFWNDFEALMKPQYLPEFQDELLALRKKSQALEGCGYRDHIDQVMENLGILEDEE